MDRRLAENLMTSETELGRSFRSGLLDTVESYQNKIKELLLEIVYSSNEEERADTVQNYNEHTNKIK